jgi:hypothetical protein
MIKTGANHWVLYVCGGKWERIALGKIGLLLLGVMF